LGRYFIEISYNGANYSGWQSQHNAPSVQATLQQVFRNISGQLVDIVGSSRTDAGVHALHQVAQVDFEPSMDLIQIIHRLNMALPADIAVLGMYEVGKEVNARFDARSRSYRYVICRRKDPFWKGRSLSWMGALDLTEMNIACQTIINQTDFEAFSKIHTQVNHFHCHILEAGWREEGHLVFFEISANRFLRGMVRALVGTMLKIGKGQLSVADLQQILDSRDRKKAGENVPACGLFLTEVAYDPSVRV